MSTETSIEAGDKAEIIADPNAGTGVVVTVDPFVLPGDVARVWLFTGRHSTTSYAADELRLVAKASYTDVKPAEHPAVTELREAWEALNVEPLEAVADDLVMYAHATHRRLARAVLAVIDLIPKPDPCGEQSLAGWYEAMEDENRANAAEAEVTRLRAELDEARTEVIRRRDETERATRERDEAREAEGHAAHYVEHWCERAEAAEAASSRLVEAMEKLANEFDGYGAEINQYPQHARGAYRLASLRIRAAVKAATETGGCNG